MFWGFGYQNQSVIDGILEKQDLTLEMLLEEDDLIPECKSHHTKLIEFLAQPDNLSRMIELLAFGDDNYDESKQFKYSLICAEIICCELWPILDGLANHPEILDRFWSFIETDEPLIPYRANCFSRICIILIQTKPQVMINFIKNKENSIVNILKHIENSSISDLLLKLMLIEDIDNTYQIFEWLRDEHVISQLIDRLNPYNDPEQHSLIIQILLEINALNYNQVVMATMTENIIATGEDGSILSLTQPKSINKVALIDEIKEEEIFTRLINFMFDNEAPYSTSSLINGINIIIELIRKYCSDIEQIEYQYHQYKLYQENVANNNGKNGSPQIEEVSKPSEEQLYMLATSINTILHIINGRLADFKNLLSHPKSITGPVDTTLGKQIPLGSERLRICELFAEIMHLQYLFTSSPLFGEVINSKEPENSDIDSKKEINETLKNEGWIEYASKILPETKFQDCQPLGGERPNNTSLLFRPNPFEVAGDVDNIGNVLSDVDGLDMNEPSLDSGFGSSSSVGSDSMLSIESSMLSSINSEKMIIPSTSSSVNQIPITTSEYLTSSHNSLNKSWTNITSNGSTSSLNFNSNSNLHSMPSTPNTAHNSPNGSKSNSLNKLSKKTEKESNSDDEDDDVEGFGNVSVMNNIKSDQFARYICQQVVNDLPGKFLVEDNSDSSDTDEELEWLRTIEDNDEDSDHDSRNKVSPANLDLPDSKYNFDNLSAVDIKESNSDLIFPQLKDTFETNDLREAINSIDSPNS
ncbi:hypothetical protein PIROE2DRAFT_58078 [Piromyces sp. E2]|nr:hypothetical protein PIROE2DRAFT_58078 [Piromyces sp. E2]|eukprot:OUM68411.1 hypothetical protein PIROE2DRAFT_58078 [Piromyces sp. E2]